MMDSSPVITISNVRKTFRSTEVLRGASCAILPGTLTAVMGPSGSGKSTLLNVFSGLLVPEEGEVSVLGYPLHSLSEDERSRVRLHELGMVFQFFHLLPSLTAFDNARLPALLAGGGALEDLDERVRHYFERFGLADRASFLPERLSGGQMQRVALIRALCNRPKILLADEPTGNLDSVSGSQVIHMLRQIVEQDGVTVVVVTHDAQLAAQADAVITISDGVCVPKGSDEQGSEKKGRNG